jgi:hypothetical protein
MCKICITSLLAVFIANFIYGQNTEKDSINDELKKVGLSKTFVEDWKKDSLGCMGLRSKHFEEIDGNKKLIGMSYSSFIKIFGNPNYERTWNYFILTYRVSSKCDSLNRIIHGNDKAYYEDFAFKDDILTSCDMIVP